MPQPVEPTEDERPGSSPPETDTSPSIVPQEAMIAEIDRETEKNEAILAYMDTELTPQTRKVLDLRFGRNWNIGRLLRNWASAKWQFISIWRKASEN